MSQTLSNIAVLTHCNDLGGKIWNPAIRWTRKYAVFIEVTDNHGRCGLGECWCFDTAPDALVAFLRTEVIPQFLGVAVEDVTPVAQRLVAQATLTARHGILRSALSGIDIATWDLTAKTRGVPLWTCLSPEGPGEAGLYASGGLYGTGKTTADLVTEMTGFADRGFRLSKMKVGAEDLEADIARVTAVLSALPAEAKLIIDGVYSYSSDQAMTLFDALPPGRIHAFQSPTKSWDYGGMARLSRAGVPVMATEAEYRDELHIKLVEDAEVAFLQTAPIAAGGLSRVQALADLVRPTHTRLSLEVSSTAVALMAAAHAAASESQIADVEHHMVHSVFYDRLYLRRNPLVQDHFSLPDQAGLGITLPPSLVSVAFEAGAGDAPQDAA
ncbi:MAG: enolase C-terminal domain-like protein [Pseudomonadota bacterium]